MAARVTIVITPFMIALVTWMVASLNTHEVRQAVDEQVRGTMMRDIDSMEQNVRDLQRTNMSDHQLIKERLGGIAEDMAVVKAKINGG
jgi:hypothetical protein